MHLLTSATASTRYLPFEEEQTGEAAPEISVSDVPGDHSDHTAGHALADQGYPAGMTAQTPAHGISFQPPDRGALLGSGYFGDAIAQTPVAQIDAEAAPVCSDVTAKVSESTPEAREPTKKMWDMLQDGGLFLDELQGAEAARVLWLVQNASTEIINALDGTDTIRALLTVAGDGQLEACKALLARDDFEGVNACDVIGSNALHLAAGNDSVEVCQALLECPRFLAGVNATNFHMRTALDFAVEFGDGDAVDVLQAAGGISAGSSRKDARKSGRWTINTGSLDLEPDAELPELDEFEDDLNRGEAAPDMSELD